MTERRKREKLDFGSKLYQLKRILAKCRGTLPQCRPKLQSIEFLHLPSRFPIGMNGKLTPVPHHSFQKSRILGMRNGISYGDDE